IGKERDEETNLCYHVARNYAPWLGRWTSADPGGLVDGLNLYIYSLNRPLSLVDSGGLEGERPKINQISIQEKAKLGKAYEREWQRHFESRPETTRVARQTTWKDPTTGKSVKLQGKTRMPDLAVETELSPGEATAVEVSSPPNFASSGKAAQAARDVEAI